MALNFGQSNLFPHNNEFSQGVGTRGIRIGAETILVSKDGSGDFVDLKQASQNLSEETEKIYIKEGTYTINSTITIEKEGLTIEGGGAGTIIKKTGNYNFFNIGNGTDVVEQISIKGLKLNAENYDGILINLRNANNCIIENNILKRDSNSNSYHIGIDSNSDNNIINSCNSDAPAYGWEYFIEGENNRINNCTLQSIYCSGNHNVLTGCIFVGEGGYDYVVFISGDNNIISNNQFKYVASQVSYGIALDSAKYCMVIGNKIKFNCSDGINLDSSDTNYNTITGNSISNATDGVEIESGCTKNNVTGNNCYGCTNAVNDNGTSNAIINNNI